MGWWLQWLCEEDGGRVSVPAEADSSLPFLKTFVCEFMFTVFSFLDKNFKTFIAYLIFGQIQLPGAVLNAELLQLSETVLGFKI